MVSLKEIFTITDQLKYMQGVESRLRLRRRNGLLATIVTLSLGLIQALWKVSADDATGSIANYMKLAWESTILCLEYLWTNLLFLIGGEYDKLDTAPFQYDVIGIYLVILGLAIYYFSRHTAFLFKKSEEAFRYTFWIEKFVDAGGTQATSGTNSDSSDLHQLLHHDLMQTLNQRIGRFSILEVKHTKSKENEDVTSPSHIHIDGHYAIRNVYESAKEITVVEIMPRVRIGPEGSPSILAQPVQIELSKSEPNRSGVNKEITPVIYAQLLEEVYSKLASEIYKQLKSDIEDKLELFPTKYLQVVALFNEAMDFSRSNTIDSYDYAIDLYRKALRYYDISFRALLSRLCLHIPLFRLGMDYELLRSRMQVEYAKNLIYRRDLSSLTGRTQNSLFEIPKILNLVTRRLGKIHNKFNILELLADFSSRLGKSNAYEVRRYGQSRLYLALTSLTYKTDTWVRKYLTRKLDYNQFIACKHVLFEAYVTLALAYAKLNSLENAVNNRKLAVATYPEESERSSLYLMTKAEIEVDLDSKIPLLIMATELSPSFEIARYFLAKYSLQQFLRKGEIDVERAEPVINEFRKVLEINPGNIATYAQLGNLYWLVECMTEAKEQFELGKKTKSIIQQTFVGELNYGLAKIAGRNGEFNKCFDLYNEALAAEPGVGAYGEELGAGKSRAILFFDYITPAMLDRYKRYLGRFEDPLLKFEQDGGLSLGRVKPCDIQNPQALFDTVKSNKWNLNKVSDKNKLDAVMQAQSQESSILTVKLADYLNSLINMQQLAKKIEHHCPEGHEKSSQLRKQLGKKVLGTKGAYSFTLHNRLLLESVFENAITPYDADRFCDSIGIIDNAILKDQEEKVVTLNTLKRTYSYVLNDYGNACLNYFHRYGDKKCLNTARKAYRRSIAAHPENAITHFNYENAESWYYSYFDSRVDNESDDRVDLLNDAESLTSFSWLSAILKLANSRMERSTANAMQHKHEIEKHKRQIKESEEKINSYARDIKKYEEIKQDIEAEIKTNSNNIEDIQSKIEDFQKKTKDKKITAPLIPESHVDKEMLKEVDDKRRPGPIVKMEPLTKSSDLESKLKALLKKKIELENSKSAQCREKEDLLTKKNNVETEIVAIKKLISETEKKLEEINREFNDSFIKAVQPIVQISRFASIIDHFGYIDNSQAVSRLVALQIPEDRVRNIDIEVILGWASLLGRKEDDSVALNESIELFRFAGNYLPEKFAIDYTSLTTYQNLERLRIIDDLNKFGIENMIGDDLLKKSFNVDTIKQLKDSELKLTSQVDDWMVKRFQAPFFTASDIVNTELLIEKLTGHYNSSIPKDLRQQFSEIIKDQRKHNIEKNNNIVGRIIRFLNKMMQQSIRMDNFSTRSLSLHLSEEIVRSANDKQLIGYDLHRFNRFLIENMLEGALRTNKIMQVYEITREKIIKEWLGSDPIHFITLEFWAPSFLYFPEIERCLEKAIDQGPPHLDKLHAQLAKAYEERCCKAYQKEKFEKAKNKYPNVPVYQLKLSQVLREEGRNDKDCKEEIAEIRGVRLKQARELTEAALEKNYIGESSEYGAKFRKELEAIFTDQAGYYNELFRFDEVINLCKDALKIYKDDANITNLLHGLRKKARRSLITQHYGELWSNRPLVVTPVAMEVATNLIPFTEGEEGAIHPDLTKEIDQMRDRLESNLGIRIPGVRFRGIEYDLPDGTYVINLNEIPIVSGNICIDKRFVSGNFDPQKYGIKSEEAKDPKTGYSGYWIKSEDLLELSDADIETWRVMRYPVRHLEAILEKNMVDFLGQTEIQHLILNKAQAHEEYFDKNKEDLVQLATVLKGLVSEGVAVTAFESIVSGFLDMKGDFDNLTELMCALRSTSDVHRLLPGNLGNIGNFDYLVLSEDLEKIFEQSIHMDNGASLLAILPEDAQDVLSAVRGVAKNRNSEVVIVENHRIRPFVSQLLKLEFDNIAVISRQELLDNGETNIQPTLINMDNGKTNAEPNAIN